jgi:hypothetical protein
VGRPFAGFGEGEAEAADSFEVRGRELGGTHGKSEELRKEERPGLGD